MLIKNAQVFLPDGRFHKTDVRFGERVLEVGAQSAEGLDAADLLLLPGLVDLHTHGAMGQDASDGIPESIRQMAAHCANNGVTSFLPTTMSLDEATLTRAVRVIRDHPDDGGAHVLGVRLEGPFFNVLRKGAQAPEHICAPDIGMLMRLNEASGKRVRIVDIAPELPGAMEFISEAAKVCRVSLAHTTADYDTARRAFASGAKQVTHLFNAMEPLLHRAPGLVGAAADENAVAELICDGMHIHPAVVRAVFRLFDNVCLISDSMRGAGLPDGEYSLGGLPVRVSGGKCTLADGTLAGSGINLMTALRNAVSFGAPLEKAVAAATSTPAQALGMEREIGCIRQGARADLVLLDKALNIVQIYIDGKPWEASRA